MRPTLPTDLYSHREIALAAGVSEADVLAVLGPAREFVPHDEAVRVGRLLAGLAQDPQSEINRQSAIRDPQSAIDPQSPIRIPQSRGLPLAVSSTLHVALTALVFLATFDLAPRAAVLKPDDRPAEPMRLVFLATPGPGGGGRRRWAAAEGAAAKSHARRPSRHQQSPAGARRAETGGAGAEAAGAEAGAAARGGTASARDRADYHRAGRHAQPHRRAGAGDRRKRQPRTRQRRLVPARAKAPASAKAMAAGSVPAREAAPAADRTAPAAASSRRGCCAK